MGKCQSCCKKLDPPSVTLLTSGSSGTNSNSSHADQHLLVQKNHQGGGINFHPHQHPHFHGRLPDTSDGGATRGAQPPPHHIVLVRQGTDCVVVSNKASLSPGEKNRSASYEVTTNSSSARCLGLGNSSISESPRMHHTDGGGDSAVFSPGLGNGATNRVRQHEGDSGLRLVEFMDRQSAGSLDVAGDLCEDRLVDLEMEASPSDDSHLMWGIPRQGGLIQVGSPGSTASSRGSRGDGTRTHAPVVWESHQQQPSSALRDSESLSPSPPSPSPPRGSTHVDLLSRDASLPVLAPLPVAPLPVAPSMTWELPSTEESGPTSSVPDGNNGTATRSPAGKRRSSIAALVSVAAGSDDYGESGGSVLSPTSRKAWLHPEGDSFLGTDLAPGNAVVKPTKTHRIRVRGHSFTSPYSSAESSPSAGGPRVGVPEFEHEKSVAVADSSSCREDDFPFRERRRPLSGHGLGFHAPTTTASAATTATTSATTTVASPTSSLRVVDRHGSPTIATPPPGSTKAAGVAEGGDSAAGECEPQAGLPIWSDSDSGEDEAFRPIALRGSHRGRNLLSPVHRSRSRSQKLGGCGEGGAAPPFASPPNTVDTHCLSSEDSPLPPRPLNSVPGSVLSTSTATGGNPEEPLPSAPPAPLPEPASVTAGESPPSPSQFLDEVEAEEPRTSQSMPLPGMRDPDPSQGACHSASALSEEAKQQRLENLAAVLSRSRSRMLDKGDTSPGEDRGDPAVVPTSGSSPEDPSLPSGVSGRSRSSSLVNSLAVFRSQIPSSVISKVPGNRRPSSPPSPADSSSRSPQLSPSPQPDPSPSSSPSESPSPDTPHQMGSMELHNSPPPQSHEGSLCGQQKQEQQPLHQLLRERLLRERQVQGRSTNSLLFQVNSGEGRPPSLGEIGRLRHRSGEVAVAPYHNQGSNRSSPSGSSNRGSPTTPLSASNSPPASSLNSPRGSPPISKTSPRGSPSPTIGVPGQIRMHRLRERDGVSPPSWEEGGEEDNSSESPLPPVLSSLRTLPRGPTMHGTDVFKSQGSGESQTGVLDMEVLERLRQQKSQQQQNRLQALMKQARGQPASRPPLLRSSTTDPGADAGRGDGDPTATSPGSPGGGDGAEEFRPPRLQRSGKPNMSLLSVSSAGGGGGLDSPAPEGNSQRVWPSLLSLHGGSPNSSSSTDSSSRGMLEIPKLFAGAERLPQSEGTSSPMPSDEAFPGGGSVSSVARLSGAPAVSTKGLSPRPSSKSPDRRRGSGSSLALTQEDRLAMVRRLSGGDAVGLADGGAPAGQRRPVPKPLKVVRKIKKWGRMAELLPDPAAWERIFSFLSEREVMRTSLVSWEWKTMIDEFTSTALVRSPQSFRRVIKYPKLNRLKVVVHAEAIEEIVIFLLAQKFNVLNFSGCSMGPPGAVAVSHLLMSNKDLVSLDLSSNGIAEGVCALGEALAVNQSLTELSLQWNDISSGVENYSPRTCQEEVDFLGDPQDDILVVGARSLAMGLLSNRTLRKLDLRGNFIGMDGARVLLEALQSHPTLVSLDLSENSLGTESGPSVQQFLECNSTLEFLGLSGNELGFEQGLDCVLQGLRANHSLQSLDISRNRLRDAGAIKVSDFLSTNPMLKKLDLSWEGIGKDGIVALSAGLRENRRLRTLILMDNNIEDPEAEVLTQALEHSASLRTVNLSGNLLSAQMLSRCQDTNKHLFSKGKILELL